MTVKNVIRQACITATCVVMGTTAVFAADMGQATGTDINVRVAAGTSADVLGKISAGTKYEVTGKSGSWYQISYNGQNGFVAGDYFKVTSADGKVTANGVNIRSEASTNSDVIGTANAGEVFKTVGRNDGWYQIEYNGKEAYIGKDYLTGENLSVLTEIGNAGDSITPAAAQRQYAVVNAGSGLKLRKEASLVSNILQVLPNGAVVDVDRVGEQWVRVITESGQKGYVSAEYVSIHSGEKPARTTTYSTKGAEVVNYAKQFVGTPYVWGGTNLNSGVDCSGFVYAVLRNFGVTVNRSSATMVNNGVSVSKSELQAGDLVFFNSGGNSQINHVGIYMGDGRYIHSTDGKGNGVTITNLNSGYSARTYVCARRVL